MDRQMTPDAGEGGSSGISLNLEDIVSFCSSSLCVNQCVFRGILFDYKVYMLLLLLLDHKAS